MRIRLSYTDTHTTPLHARGGRYTRRSGGESAIATAPSTPLSWARRRSISISTTAPSMMEGRDDTHQTGRVRAASLWYVDVSGLPPSLCVCVCPGHLKGSHTYSPHPLSSYPSQLSPSSPPSPFRSLRPWTTPPIWPWLQPRSSRPRRLRKSTCVTVARPTPDAERLKAGRRDDGVKGGRHAAIVAVRREVGDLAHGGLEAELLLQPLAYVKRAENGCGVAEGCAWILRVPCAIIAPRDIL